MNEPVLAAVMIGPVLAGANPLPDSLPDVPAELDQPQIEDQNIPLTSNGNIGPAYGDLEISHRISNADHHLSRIQFLIAEKSFQYCYSRVQKLIYQHKVKGRS